MPGNSIRCNPLVSKTSNIRLPHQNPPLSKCFDVRRLYLSILLHLGRSVSECLRTDAFAVNGNTHILQIHSGNTNTKNKYKYKKQIQIQNIKLLLTDMFAVNDAHKHFSFTFSNANTRKQGSIITDTQNHLHRPRYAFPVTGNLMKVFRAWL